MGVNHLERGSGGGEDRTTDVLTPNVVVWSSLGEDIFSMSTLSPGSQEWRNFYGGPVFRAVAEAGLPLLSWWVTLTV